MGKGVVVKLEDLKAYLPAGHTNTDSWKLMGKEQGSLNASIFLTEMRPGAVAEKHTHPFDSFYIVVSGRGRLEIAGETFVAGHNTCVFIPKDTEHAVREIVGNEVWRIYVIGAPSP